MKTLWIVKELSTEYIDEDGGFTTWEIIGIYDNLEMAQITVKKSQFKRKINTVELNQMYEDGI
jgi:hypothetical protein